MICYCCEYLTAYHCTKGLNGWVLSQDYYLIFAVQKTCNLKFIRICPSSRIPMLYELLSKKPFSSGYFSDLPLILFWGLNSVNSKSAVEWWFSVSSTPSHAFLGNNLKKMSTKIYSGVIVTHHHQPLEGKNPKRARIYRPLPSSRLDFPLR